MQRITGLVVFLGVLPAIASAGEKSGDPTPTKRGTYILERGAVRGNFPLKHRVIFVNRGGGGYQPVIGAANEDSSTNKSSIIEEPATIAPFNVSDSEWADVMTCIQRIYSPYAVDVVDVEPDPSTNYVESVVGGHAADLTLRDPPMGGFLGISPNLCRPIERGINFTMAADICTPGSCSAFDLKFICDTIAQESGHMFGLDHALNWLGPMTYLGDCGDKMFVDAQVECGESNPRACKCGTTFTQNSHVYLRDDVFGPADFVPPTMSITSPAEGATVPVGFEITAMAQDDVRIDRVEFFVDEVLIGADADIPYRFIAPGTVGPGPHVLRVVAVDGDENRVEASVSFNVETQCTGVSDGCGENQVCQAGVCLGDTGASCNAANECASQVCYIDEVSEPAIRICTTICSTDDDTCPDGFECTDTGFGDAKCLPGGGGGGGCVVGERRPVGLVALAMAAVLLGFVLVRRRVIG